MADLKAGSTVGGSPIWHAGTFPLIPAGNSLTFKGFKVYTENDKPQAVDNDFVSKAQGGSYEKRVTFKDGIVVQDATGQPLNLIKGSGDGASFDKVNAVIDANWGVGISSYSNGNKGVVIVFDSRTGNIISKGSVHSSDNHSTDAPAPLANNHLTRKDYVDNSVKNVDTIARAAVMRKGDIMTGLLTAPNFISTNIASREDHVPQFGQVIAKGTTIDFGYY